MIQSREECMSRLDLSMSDPADLTFIYERLCGLEMPRKIETIASLPGFGLAPMGDLS